MTLAGMSSGGRSPSVPKTKLLYRANCRESERQPKPDSCPSKIVSTSYHDPTTRLPWAAQFLPDALRFTGWLGVTLRDWARRRRGREAAGAHLPCALTVF
eukprot:3715586-Pleurochrysis_carterae.AAC.1